jgi:hypothetical protein
MSQVQFEPTIPMFEQAKTSHASDLTATVFGFDKYLPYKKLFQVKSLSFLIFSFHVTGM